MRVCVCKLIDDAVMSDDTLPVEVMRHESPNQPTTEVNICYYCTGTSYSEHCSDLTERRRLHFLFGNKQCFKPNYHIHNYTLELFFFSKAKNYSFSVVSMLLPIAMLLPSPVSQMDFILLIHDVYFSLKIYSCHYWIIEVAFSNLGQEWRCRNVLFLLRPTIVYPFGTWVSQPQSPNSPIYSFPKKRPILFICSHTFCPSRR